MIPAVAWTTVASMTLVVLVAGATNGLAGIGFAVVGSIGGRPVHPPPSSIRFRPA